MIYTHLVLIMLSSMVLSSRKGLLSMNGIARKGLLSMNGIARKGLLSYRDNNPAVGRTSSAVGITLIKREVK